MLPRSVCCLRHVIGINEYSYTNLFAHSLNLLVFLRYLNHLFQYSTDVFHKALSITMYSNQVAGHTNEVLVKHKNYLLKPSRKENVKKLLFLRELLIYEGFNENIHASDACRIPYHFVPKVSHTSFSHLYTTHSLTHSFQYYGVFINTDHPPQDASLTEFESLDSTSHESNTATTTYYSFCRYFLTYLLTQTYCRSFIPVLAVVISMTINHI